jgi:hypothetical protein
MASKEGSAVAERPSGAVMTKEQADALMDDGESMRMDFEKSDVSQTFLKVAQALSPELDAEESQHIDGLKLGDIFSNGTGHYWSGKEGVLVAAIHYQKGFTEWAPREASVALVNDFGPSRPAFLDKVEQVKGQWPLDNGNTVIESAVYYLMVIDPKTFEYEQCVLNLSGTQHKKARRWNRDIENSRAKHPTTGQVFIPAPFYYPYLLTTTPEENASGKWRGLVIKQHPTSLLALPGGAEMYQLCRDERALIKGGLKKVQTVQPNTVEREPGEEPPVSADGEGDEDIPF